MAFGSPGYGVAFINLAFVLVGGSLIVYGSGLLWWLGAAFIMWGVLAGLLTGSWFQFVPGSKPIEKHTDVSESPAERED